MEPLAIQGVIHVKSMFVLLLLCLVLLQRGIEGFPGWQPLIVELIRVVEPLVREDAFLAEDLVVLWEYAFHKSEILVFVIFVIEVLS